MRILSLIGDFTIITNYGRCATVVLLLRAGLFASGRFFAIDRSWFLHSPSFSGMASVAHKSLCSLLLKCVT